MVNVKYQISNVKLNPKLNEMPKQVRHDKNVILNSFQNLILEFGIHLAFACLPRPRSGPGPVGRDFEI